jgi:hypothetical protein
MFADINTGSFALIKSSHLTTGFETRLIKLGYSNPGSLSWTQVMYHSTALSNPIKAGSIAGDANYVYSCLTFLGSVP